MAARGRAASAWSDLSDLSVRTELATLVEAMPAMVAGWGSDYRLRIANTSYVEWFGADRCTPGRLMADVLGPTLWRLNRPYVERAARGEAQRFQRTLLDRRGDPRQLDLCYVPHLAGADVVGFFAIVTDRSSHLQAEWKLREANHRVAVLQEQNRIAADLHDAVVQRLFAAGTTLSAAARDTDGSRSAARIAAAAQEIDASITELRRAVHGLAQGSDSRRLPAALDRVVASGAEALGFAPTLTVRGSLLGVPASLSHAVLNVLGDALDNVARHAHARQVQVTLSTTGGKVSLGVADDGRGITDAEIERLVGWMGPAAERLGATVTCRSTRPGTLLEWSVPLPG